MPIVPLFGHHTLRERIAAAARRGTLPATLLLTGPRGVGKQRLALWVASLLTCDRADVDACGACPQCRLSATLTHPDVHWFFPRPRPKDADPEVDDVRADYAAAIAERVEDGGLYAAPTGSDAIFVATVRALVHQAARTPALARRKVFIIGDAERMVPQEGSEQAANAFLKLLEEPPADTTILLTTSEPGALLPTVRSRVVSMRLGPLSPDDVGAFLALPAVAERLRREDDVPTDNTERLNAAAGAPGRLFGGTAWRAAKDNAARMLAALSGKASEPLEASLAQASARARGAFADSLDELTVRLHARTRSAAMAGDGEGALAAARAVDAIEIAKERILTNVSPQLVTAGLLADLGEALS